MNLMKIIYIFYTSIQSPIVLHHIFIIEGGRMSGHVCLLAVKRVVQNKGGKTQPLKRIYIPKNDGCLRPLSIPTMN